jgi:hypothetical protein
MPHPLKIRLPILVGLGACLFCHPSALAVTDSDNVTVVSSRVSDAYTRVRLADGSFQQETYAYAKGGLWTGGVDDASIDHLAFMDVAKTIAVPLANRNYVPAKDPKNTRLLIVLYWGRTSSPERAEASLAMERLQDAQGPAAKSKSDNNQTNIAATTSLNSTLPAMACGHFEATVSTAESGEQTDSDNSLTGAMAMVAAVNHNRDQADAQIASLLGYDSWWAETEALRGTPREYRRQDMINELEHDRYYVVLMAYDFQKAWKQKKRQLLWETRFSIRQRGHDFDTQLVAMAQEASKYFGRDSHGLARELLPEGRVEVGDLKTLGIVDAK